MTHAYSRKETQESQQTGDIPWPFRGHLHVALVFSMKLSGQNEIAPREQLG